MSAKVARSLALSVYLFVFVVPAALATAQPPLTRLSKAVAVPFSYVEREILVKGRIEDGETFDFLFDTGASETIVDRRVAADSLLVKQGDAQIAAVGGSVSAKTCQIRRLEIGDLIVNDIDARILDLSQQSRHLGRPIGGIIGTNVINRYACTIDYGDSKLRFGDAQTYEPSAKAQKAQFVIPEAPVVEATLDGSDKRTLLVDTGAAFNYLPNAAARLHLKGADPAQIKHFTEGTGLDGKPVKLGQLSMDSVSVAGQILKNVSFTYPADNASATQPPQPPKEHTGPFYQESTSGILGNPFFENFITTIDPKSNCLWLEASPFMRQRIEIDRAIADGDLQAVTHRNYRGAEIDYQKAIVLATNCSEEGLEARAYGRLANLRRMMAHDLKRPEHAASAYTYFVKADELSRKVQAQEIRARVLADWSLLYSDQGQTKEAQQMIDRALQLAPQDPSVNVDYAVHLYRAHNYVDMQKYVEKTLFLEPNNWQALWFQVKLSEIFSDNAKAAETLKEILRYYPFSQAAQSKLKEVKAKQDRPQVKPDVAPVIEPLRPR